MMRSDFLANQEPHQGVRLIAGTAMDRERRLYCDVKLILAAAHRRYTAYPDPSPGVLTMKVLACVALSSLC